MAVALVLTSLPTPPRLAGYETSSTALTWTLHLLAEHPEIQDRLRAELLAISESEPEMDALNGLPYLDAVVRESLRVNAPVSNSQPDLTRIDQPSSATDVWTTTASDLNFAAVREAAEDDVVPLSEPILGRDGREHKEITIGKGETVFIGILNMNRAPEIWGADAAEFKCVPPLCCLRTLSVRAAWARLMHATRSISSVPLTPPPLCVSLRRPERWIDGALPETAAKGIEAPWAHLATFLAGPRGCIGWRFALLEIKAFLFVLLRSLKFDNPTPALTYVHRTALVQRPLIKGREDEGYQMRLKLSKI